MTSARAHRELACLQREGWFAAVLPALDGEGGILAVAELGHLKLAAPGATLADAMPELLRQCAEWRPFAFTLRAAA